jgi:hypothetical protein
MSRANMTFTFEDGIILHGLYDGTVDSEWNFMCHSSDEAWDRKREYYDKIFHLSKLKPKCTCGDEPEDIEVHNHYGNGEYYNGKACRKCMVYLGRDN